MIARLYKTVLAISESSAAMKILILIAVLVGCSLAEDCLRCICNKESYGCKPIGCKPDKGSLSCGYYQIKKNYYIDCGEPGKKGGESTETAWKRCADDYDCATRCVKAYIARYSSRCPASMGSCEKTARLHNGGGTNGCRNLAATQGYWNAIRGCCQCN